MKPFLPVTIAFAALVATPLLGAGPASLEGRWTLVAQSYGDGDSELANLERPLRLELVRQTDGWAGRVWAGDDRGAALPWPAFASDEGPRPLSAVEIRHEPSTGRLTASYEVRPSVDDPLVLRIVESYAVQDGGDVLAGTMTVSFETLP